MSPNIRDAALLRLSISFALSQSVKLSVLEERVLRMAAMTKPLPLALAREGKVKIRRAALLGGCGAFMAVLVVAVVVSSSMGGCCCGLGLGLAGTLCWLPAGEL
jgi:uncharacterized Rmd1/YagE family protein